jgi:hypothetical protein
MLSGRAMYIWRLKNVVGSGSADAVVAQAKRAKISSLWVKIGDGSKAFENTKGGVGKLLQQLVAKSAAAGISVFGYHVPWCADEQSTAGEIEFLAKTVSSLKLAGVVVDNEDGSSYFKGTAATAAQYATGLSQAMKQADKQVLMSSNDIVSLHPNAYAEIIGRSIDINAPQVYYGQSASVSSRLNRAVRENKNIDKPFFPVGAAFLRNETEDDGGFLDSQTCAAWAKDFIDLVSLLHHSSPDQYPGYGFWDWEEAPEEFWQVLYDTDVFVQPSSEPTPALLTLASTSGAPVADFAAMATGGSTASKGWTLTIQRVRSEMRAGEGFARTVGTYSVLRDGVAQAALSGMTVERQGPGDNGSLGKQNHRCIAAGSYPLRAHASAKYKTTGYASDGNHPRPAIEVGNTGERDGILVHPADRYGSTIGCINLSGLLTNADSDILLPDSVKRVIAVIEDLRAYCGGRLNLAEDGSVQNARIVITDQLPVVATASMLLTESLAVTAPVAAAIPAGDCQVFEQATGRMLIKQDGKYDTLGVGYSGSLSKGGRNDPSKQCESDIGPIPRGLYTIGPPGPGPSPYSLRLTPDPSNDMCGRSGFLIHGDSVSHPGDASDGCIILSRAEREAIVKSGIKLLCVTDHISS